LSSLSQRGQLLMCIWMVNWPSSSVFTTSTAAHLRIFSSPSSFTVASLTGTRVAVPGRRWVVTLSRTRPLMNPLRLAICSGSTERSSPGFSTTRRTGAAFMTPIWQMTRPESSPAAYSTTTSRFLMEPVCCMSLAPIAGDW